MEVNFYELVGCFL